MEYIMIFLMIIIIIIQIIIYMNYNSKNHSKNLNKIEEKLVKIQMTSDAIPETVKLKTHSSVKDNMITLSENMIDRFAKLEIKLNKDFSLFKEEMKKDLNQDFKELNNTIEKRLDKINERVEDKLKEGFNKTNDTFNNILIRLSKIDEAQKKIDSLSGEIVSLQDVLTDKKSRGIFGEIQLNQILHSIFGEKNDKVFKIQHKLNNSTIVDAMVFGPEPIGNIGIDSKFPLENYKKMIDRSLGLRERELATKDFKSNVKKHIDDIANKYIIHGQTSDQAIMFLPAEAIFAEINAYHMDIINYSQKKKVWITSPTTLMAILTTLQVVLRNAEREKYAHEIQNELAALGTEFSRYKKRWDNLSKHMDTVHKDVKEIHTTTDKIGRKFESISKVDIQKQIKEDER